MLTHGCCGIITFFVDVRMTGISLEACFFYIHKQPRRKRSRLERSPSKRKAGCSNSSRDRPKSLKPVLTVPLANRWAISVSVMERRRWLLHADSRCGKLKNPHCSMAISGEHKSKFAAFTSNGEVSIWVKYSQVGRNRGKINKYIYKAIH